MNISTGVKQALILALGIIVHTLERYFTPYQTLDLVDQMAESLVRTVIKNAKDNIYGNNGVINEVNRIVKIAPIGSTIPDIISQKEWQLV